MAAIEIDFDVFKELTQRRRDESVTYNDVIRALLGWQPHYVNTLFLHDWSQLMAIRFTPLFAYAQTPGPGAGARMPLQPVGPR